MKILLFTFDKLYTFYLPEQIFGSFYFDYDNNNDSKLINIEAIDGKWNILSSSGVKVYHNNVFSSYFNLENNNFYTLVRDDSKYLIYIEPLYDNSFSFYKYNKNINLIIGNSSKCNIIYNCSFINDIAIIINYDSNKNCYQLKKIGNIYIYINNIIVNEFNESITLNSGDVIDILGLKIIFMNNKILINNLNNMVSIDQLSTGLSKISIDNNKTEFFNKELKEIDLYSSKDYFSKSPRIRRTIEKKDFVIVNPPDVNIEENSLLMSIIPSLAFGLTSIITLANTIININNGKRKLSDSWPSLAISGAMLLSTLFWPIFMKLYTDYIRKRKIKSNIIKYDKYLAKKKDELENEYNFQKTILFENLISTEECYKIAVNKSLGLWSRRIDQKDFLTVRIGKGNVKLDINIKYSDEEFSIYDNILKDKISKLIREYEVLYNVPIGYSFLDKRITDIMGSDNKSYNFIKNLLLQITTLHSYEDLKLVLFTTESNSYKWDFIKYLPHNFSDQKDAKFYACNKNEYNDLSNYMLYELTYRKSNSNSNTNYTSFKPYYLILTDCYMKIRNLDIIKEITESDINFGYSLICIENRLSRLPSKCDNFISIGENVSGILENAYENLKKTSFTDEINPNLNMKNVCNILSNIPIEFESSLKQLPNFYTFLEMENVGKIEQLNILNRWKTNDPINSLRAEVGIDENGDIMYLDIHEKYHGPHGLIAGMTGSGKSEFIITYVLSMALNYSPDYVSFILIDYKGGGLAGAFENNVTGIRLPHLAGVITNLDKSELDRTLISINSEVVRRQTIFNKVRDELGQSTIDIYRYQSFYREGKINEPIPHLIIICDEFAELKSQQPDFIDDLISIARIGRSLGIHLILATQKPSGVVNDQIWSNSKFRVCLKVQDKSDSMEMLKRPEAAELKQVGRFYLQVGYNEYFSLGQSAWCGAKYFPSDKIKKNYDRSVDFINNVGYIYKSIQASFKSENDNKGEELINILKYIIYICKKENIFCKKLWLESIPGIILVDDLIKKYNLTFNKYDVNAIIGEYDIPAMQSQKMLLLNLNTEGNIVIYGNNSNDREMVLNSIIYSTSTRHNVEELNYYIIDYGSETLRIYNSFPNIGDMVFYGDDEKLLNLFRMITDEINNRKKLFADFGGSYNSFIKKSNNKLPLIGVIINNYDMFYDNNVQYEENIIQLTRDCIRYGIFFCITAVNDNSLKRKVKQNFNSVLVLRQNDINDYNNIFGRIKINPKDILGRGLYKINHSEEVYEFQTSSIVKNNDLINDYIENVGNQLKKLNNNMLCPKIPTLPEIIPLELLMNNLTSIDKLPIGMYKNSLKIAFYDFTSSPSSLILSNSSANTISFSKMLLLLLSRINNLQLIVIDFNKELIEIEKYIGNYFNCDGDKVMKTILDYLNSLNENIPYNVIIFIQNFSKFKLKVLDKDLTNLSNIIIKKEKINLIIADDFKKIRKCEYDNWFRNICNCYDGIWVGSGLYDQTLFKISKLTPEMKKNYKNNFGYVIKEGRTNFVKLIQYKGNGFDDK